MSNKKNSGGSYYGMLGGFHRAVPIILSAVALFITICFIAGDTGIAGQAIAAALKGLFSIGAYAIPVVIVLHAIFYAEDVIKHRLVSRVIFSVIAVVIISAIEYTVLYWNNIVFAPSEFYAQQTAGGLIGSTIAFGIIALIDEIGFIILVIATLATYATFFFSKGDSAFGKVVLSLLTVIIGALAAIEKAIKKATRGIKEIRDNKVKKESDKKSAELLDDQFFNVDNGMRELKISELGIIESRSNEAVESHPVLQGQVFHKSAVTVNEDDELGNIKVIFNEPKSAKSETEKRKSVDLSYGFDDAENIDTGFVDTGIIKEEPKREFLGIDDNAENVFTKDFDPFDFAMNAKFAEKTSSKAQPRFTDYGIKETTSPIMDITEEDVRAIREREAEERRHSDFERRKQELIARSRAAQSSTVSFEYGKQNVETEAPIVSTPTYTAEPAQSNATAYTPEPAPARDYGKTVEFKVSNETRAVNSAPISSATFSKTYDKIEHSEQETSRAADKIAEMVAMNNPAYVRSFNESYTYTKVSEQPAPQKEVTASEPVYEAQASSATAYGDGSYNKVITEYATEKPTPSQETVTEQFKPYTPPTVEEIVSESTQPVDNTLKMERTMLSPTPDAAPMSKPEYTFISEDMPKAEDIKTEIVFTTDTSATETVAEVIPGDEGTVFNFGDEPEVLVDAKEEDTASDITEIFGDGIDDEEIEPIPPEEQNPDVLKQRQMFPFLDSEPTESVSTEVECAPVTPVEVETPDGQPADDEPPFEYDEPKPEPIPAPVTELVPVEKAKKEDAGAKKKPDYSNYVFPPIDLLGLSKETSQENIQEEIQDNADKLIDTLSSFGVTASIKGVDRGPRITRYEVVPAKGVKVSNIMNLSDDIALNLAADGIRMEAPIPGKSAVGVEIPNKKASTVRLRELIETEDFRSLKSKTSVCMGKDVAGQPVFADVAKMPHALIAGATGMGKSVCINSLMISMLYKARPDEVKFIMIDPKQVEFTMYNGIPHLLVPIVNDVKQAAGTLMWAVDEMERRYGVLQSQCVRNIDAYNEKVANDPSIGEPLSRIVIVIDEFAELIMQVKNPVESLVIRIAQKARAAGIHLIIGTQKPVKEVITGLIKSNIPSKLSCKVASNRDSILIFDAAGAEKLLDKGDMLIAFANSLKPQRVQCAFVADEEVEAVMDHLRQFSDGSNYDESVMEEIRRAADKCNKKGGGGGDFDDDDDDSYGEGYLNDRQFLEAVEVAINAGKISTSLIQRKLSVGYGKAAKFIDVMEDMGIVGEPNGQKPREVLMNADQWREKLARISLD